MRFQLIIPAMLVLASPSLAQNALSMGQPNAPTRPNANASPVPGYTIGVTGRALDGNLQVGSGGFNAPVASFNQELALRNAVVTGNVAGGRAFRGDIGYTAADDFRGRTGSDDLFEFQRDSAYSGLATQGLRGITPLQFQLTESTAGQTRGVLGNLIVRRDSTTFGAENVRDVPTSSLSVDPFGNLRGSLRSTSDFLLRNARTPKIIGSLGTEEEGANRLHLAVNPLIGVKAVTLGNSMFSVQERPDLMLMGRAPDAATRQQQEENRNRPGVAEAVGQPFRPESAFDSLRADLALRADTFVSRRFGEEPEKREGAAANEQRRDSTRPSETLQQRYDRMMEELRESFRDRLSREQAGLPSESPESAPSFEPKAPPVPTDPNAPSPPALTGQELIEHAKGLLGNGEVRLQAFLAEQGADDLYSWHMNKGQEALRAERWFDAEERFTAAIRAKPGDAMAAAARVHAQIGASMFLSAGVNLRNLFSAYPELIAVRYPEDLFPRGRRLEGVRATLRDRLRLDSPFAREAALILAYVGWQTGSAEDVAEGFGALDRFHSEAGDRPTALETVLRGVWMAK